MLNVDDLSRRPVVEQFENLCSETGNGCRITWTDLMARERLLDLFSQRFLCFSSISFCFSYSYVRQTKLASSPVNIWSHNRLHDLPNATLRCCRVLEEHESWVVGASARLQMFHGDEQRRKSFGKTGRLLRSD